MQKPKASRMALLVRWPLWVALVALAAAACSPQLEIYPKLDGLARQGKFAEGVKLVEENKDKYSERNEVLYNLDRGVFYHLAGDYKASNKAFEAAERKMDELFTKSISRQIGAFVVNDNTLPYRGEDFESVVINIYRALNYIQLRDPEGALVEARKVNEKLLFINDQYEPDKRNVYREDGFARLLAGILYELGGTRDDFNDAFISNRKAVAVYAGDFAGQYGTPAPSLLKDNLIATAEFMGREELEQARRKFPGLNSPSLEKRAGQAQLFFIHFAGRAPIKVESSINALMPDGYLFRIAFPTYRKRYYSVHGSSIQVDGKPAVRLEEAQPLGAIALKNLADRKGRIAVKAIARATTKYLATKAAAYAARKQGGQVAGLLTQLGGNVFAAATEQADLRSWQTLPDRILVGRAVVAPGRHTLTAQYRAAGGGVLSTKALGTVDVKAGEARFFILYTGY